MFKFLKKIFRGGEDATPPPALSEVPDAAAEPADVTSAGAEPNPAPQPGPQRSEASAASAAHDPVPVPADATTADLQKPPPPDAAQAAASSTAAPALLSPGPESAEIFVTEEAAPAPAAAQPATDDEAPSLAATARPAVAPPAASRSAASVAAPVAPAPASPSWRAGPSLIGSALVTPLEIPLPQATPAARARWVDKLKTGLRKTGGNLGSVFTGAQITEALYEDLESALLLADTGVPATQFLLDEVRQRVKAGGATHPIAVRNALVEALSKLLKPLERELVIGQFTPTVIMVAGVNGAGKTTSIGKLTKHLSNEGAAVLLAAADTFRAAAREQLGVWADRNTVEIVSQEGGDPAAVSFDAVTAGKARGKDVVLVDTAGRLPTQLHLMDELRKIKRVVQKADASAPHEVLLVIDGNTGQNALAQVKAFDAALGLTGLIVTKLDGTAKGGMLAAIAQWGVERAHPVPVYFIGVGEKLEDLETFNAREFAQALLT